MLDPEQSQPRKNYWPLHHPHCDKTDVQPFHLPRCSIICNFKKFKLENCKCIEMFFFVWEVFVFPIYQQRAIPQYSCINHFDINSFLLSVLLVFSSVFWLDQILHAKQSTNSNIPFESSSESNSQSAIIWLKMLTLLTLLRCLQYDY